MEAEIGMIHVLAKECQGLQQSPKPRREAWNRFSLRTFRKKKQPS